VTNAPKVEPYMRIGKAAEMLGLTVAMLRTEIRNGRLKGVEIAGKWCFTESMLCDTSKPNR
jgi:hypothetical protein